MISCFFSVGVQKATRSMKGIFPLFRRYFHSAYVLVRVAQVPWKGGKYASSRLCDLTHRDFKGFQGRWMRRTRTYADWRWRWKPLKSHGLRRVALRTPTLMEGNDTYYQVLNQQAASQKETSEEIPTEALQYEEKVVAYTYYDEKEKQCYTTLDFFFSDAERFHNKSEFFRSLMKGCNGLQIKQPPNCGYLKTTDIFEKRNYLLSMPDFIQQIGRASCRERV